MTAVAVDDTWMETCFIAISKIGGQDVQFAGITSSVDMDIGEKDIEGKALTNGGRVTVWKPEGDSSITFEAYPLEAGAGRGFFDLMHTNDVITSSTTTGTTTSKLVDTNVNFTTLGVAAGDKIINTTDNTTAYVTAKDSDTILSISSDIMASSENYIISDSPYRVINTRNRDKYRVLVLWTNDTTVITAQQTTANTYSALRVGMADGQFTSVKPSFTDGELKWTVIYKCASFDKTGSGNVMIESCAGSAAEDILPAIAAYTTSYKFA